MRFPFRFDAYFNLIMFTDFASGSRTSHSSFISPDSNVKYEPDDCEVGSLNEEHGTGKPSMWKREGAWVDPTSSGSESYQEGKDAIEESSMEY